VLYQYIEELPQNMTESEFVQWAHGIPHLSSVPQPPTLPRILDKVIVNAEPKRLRRLDWTTIRYSPCRTMWC
jgi:5'-AMP-activated protein kinase regulatory beta subunit